MWINGQSAAITEGDGSSYNNDGTELAAENHQKSKGKDDVKEAGNLQKKLKSKRKNVEDDVGEAADLQQKLKRSCRSDVRGALNKKTKKWKDCGRV